jgi:glutamate-5-semialdehyde dehydrogenase
VQASRLLSNKSRRDACTTINTASTAAEVSSVSVLSPSVVSVDELSDRCADLARRAKAASRELAIAPTVAKNRWLLASASALESRADELLAANAKDVAAAPGFGLNAAAIDRLTLNPKRIAAAAEGLRQVAGLPDPVGEVREAAQRPNGLQVLKVGVPLGVVFFIYESRPNVTADAAALCVKSGNAVVLRGGKEAIHSNTAIHRLLADELTRAELPADAVQLVPWTDRQAVGYLLSMGDFIDLAIPRGGKSLIQRVAAEAKMPVLKHYDGVCHVFVDANADLKMAEQIVVNAKCQRPGTCNAAECLLVHRAVAEQFLPVVGASLGAKGVELRGCEQTRRLLPSAKSATDDDFRTEYLDLTMSVKVVADIAEAVEHIATFGSHHTDAIITRDLSAARQFTQQVDSAAVMVNASTRFNDGYELGLGAEIGISTDRFHARGPCGLRELTTYKFVVTGDGHVRE